MEGVFKLIQKGYVVVAYHYNSETKHTGVRLTKNVDGCNSDIRLNLKGNHVNILNKL